jgi:hypothetical protein
MIPLPKKREPVRSGILRGPKLVWKKHQKFIRRHTCVVTLAKIHDDCEGAVECCHWRSAANSGKGIKPPDWFTFPACSKHHREQHNIGQPAFERKYGLDLSAICAEFARLSTDTAMREAMVEHALTVRTNA